jgi:hypothetical protein
MYGAKGKVGEVAVFEQDQLKRAAELGFGVQSLAEVQLTALNAEAEADVARIKQVLKEQFAVH